MKTILNPKRYHYLARFGIFLIAVALIAGMVGCGPFLLQYNLAISSTEGGEVTTPGEGTFTYFAGTVVGLMAEAEEGYYFVEWTGDIATTACQCRSTTITMQGDYEITANFALETSEDLEIRDWYDLDAIRDNVGGSYILMNNLDSTTAGYEELASPTANGGKGWQPIGSWDTGFNGNFDGQGHAIRDLFINRPDEDCVGLFGIVHEGGHIEDIDVENATVTGNEKVGGVVALNGDGTVSMSRFAGYVMGKEDVGGLVGDNLGAVANSYAEGNLSGNTSVGGLVGFNDGTVSNSHFGGHVSGDEHVGGLVGENSYLGTISNSHSYGSVIGGTMVGGIVGYNRNNVSKSYSTGNTASDEVVGGLVGFHHDGIVSESYSTGSVASSSVAGGLIGYIYEGAVTDSYSTSNVTSDGQVGGLVGSSWNGTVSNSYSTGKVIGINWVGGLVGDNDGTVTNSFWDTETSGQATSAGGTGKTTAEMQDFATFSGATWDIVAVANPSTRNTSYIWNIVDAATYPFLSWQP